MNGENLRAAMDRKGITQAGLAEKVGRSVNSVWRWCSGSQEPDDRMKHELASALGVSVAYLMGEDDPLRPAVDINNSHISGIAGVGNQQITVANEHEKNIVQKAAEIMKMVNTADDSELEPVRVLLKATIEKIDDRANKA